MGHHDLASLRPFRQNLLFALRLPEAISSLGRRLIGSPGFGAVTKRDPVIVVAAARTCVTALRCVVQRVIAGDVHVLAEPSKEHAQRRDRAEYDDEPHFC